MDMHRNLFTYVERLESRCTDVINMAVIHCTELPDLVMARIWGEKIVHTSSQTGNSGHFYIDRDGRIEEWVPISRVAHHVRGRNKDTIGIELVNNGRYPNWHHSSHQDMTDPYPGEQIDSLVRLLGQLVSQLPGLTGVAGHEDLDTELQPSAENKDVQIRRKVDPGPLFPWDQLLSRVALERHTTGVK
jgi:N-acetylmuramoyl-L-alanine amidase